MDQQGMPPLPQFPVTPAFTRRRCQRLRVHRRRRTVTPTPPGSHAGNNGDANTTTGKSTERKPSPSVTPDDKSVEQAQKELEAASKKTGIELPEEGEINKAPFKALAMYATTYAIHNKLDLNKSFEISIETTLDKDGKFGQADCGSKIR